MAPANPVATKKYFSVEEANKTLPLVKQIVGDIVRQFQIVSDLDTRLSAVMKRDAQKRGSDLYSEELAHAKAELESEDEKLQAFREELEKLGVELKGTDGLCDFPALRDGKEVCLCWRFGEPEIHFWHETHAGFAGRQPIETLHTPKKATGRPR